MQGTSEHRFQANLPDKGLGFVLILLEVQIL